MNTLRYALILIVCASLHPAVEAFIRALGFSFWMMVVPTLCYGAIMIEQAWVLRVYPMGLVYFGYSVANCGFLWLFAQQMAKKAEGAMAVL